MRRWITLGMMTLLAAALFSQVLAQSGTAATLPPFIAALRADMELIADEVFGSGQRPELWTGSADTTSPSIIADIWFDNEQLADEVFGRGQRPADWIGATSSNPALVTRNVRHDLEVLADAVGGTDVRPPGWTGAAPFHRCSRTVLNLVYLLETVYATGIRTAPDTPGYCQALQFELEDNLADIIFGTTGLDIIPSQILAVRGDLERVADERLGLNARPEGWTFNKDVNSPALAQDNFSDMERLADDLLGEGVRPPGWVAAITDNPATTYRNLRFDLELLTDALLGTGVRPRGWQGENQLERCDVLTQSLAIIVEQQYRFTVDAAVSTSPDFCAALSLAANSQAENPPPPETADVVAAREDELYRAESQIAFTYLDVAATQYMGMMPLGTEFRAWYRNFAGSSMMFVSGADFAVFLDRRWTTMPQTTFDMLPTLDGVRPLTFCDADWCNGPSPTPTPTGGGPLLEIILGATPVPTIQPGQTQRDGKSLITWNQIRVTYRLQKPETRTAQVTLELCQDVAQITCEPVISIFNNATGVALPVVSQVNGLNVYELAYGYTSGLLIESQTLFSTDVWLNDPTLTGP